MEAWLKDPELHWYHVPRDILGLVREYLRPIEEYPTLPIRGIRYSRGQKPQVARLTLQSRVVLEGPCSNRSGWLYVVELDRQNRLILRNIDQIKLVAYCLTNQQFCEEPLTEWTRLINTKPADNPDPTTTSRQLHVIQSDCSNVYFDLTYNSRTRPDDYSLDLVFKVNPYLDGCGQAIHIVRKGQTEQQLYIYPVTTGSDVTVIPTTSRPVASFPHSIYSFQDPVALTMYFHVYGKIYRYRAGQLQLVLRTHLLNFLAAFINLEGQLVLVHFVYRQAVRHLQSIPYPFPIVNSGLATLGPNLIVSVYQ